MDTPLERKTNKRQVWNSDTWWISQLSRGQGQQLRGLTAAARYPTYLISAVPHAVAAAALRWDRGATGVEAHGWNGTTGRW